jgi:choline dehydrogenase-like flavoprotein
MATNPMPGITDFMRDVLGRYICNGLDEALRSADRTTVRPDGRPQIEAKDFDLIVIGGGTFGPAVAEHMAFRDRARQHRILVLEAGPFVLPEHVQNLPILGLNVPGATTIQELRDAGNFGPDRPRNEVWGLPWHSATRFPGLAFCLGGRSLYFGGWSPEPLSTELPVGPWPAAVVSDLTATALPDGSPGYFRQASDQIGVTQTNDFIFGDLHRAMRDQLFGGIGQVADAVPLPSLPDHPTVRYEFAGQALNQDARRALLGLAPGETPPSEANTRNQLKLEAPLAVQGESGHAGFFPFNKFSTVPLLIKAAREAYNESRDSADRGDDARKRLMIVPYCHVSRLITVPDGNEWRVVSIETNLGNITVPATAKVIIALGTIESARLALVSFGDIPPAAYDRIGTNLIAHLRSNLDIRIPRTALASLPATAAALQASALFVKGRHDFATDGIADGSSAHFHLQITASGLGAVGNNSEAELFKKIPDIDTYNVHRNANDTHVVITIRGIGEMQPQNPDNRVTLDPNPAEIDFGVRRSLVRIANPLDANQRGNNPLSAKDFFLWEAMDQAARDVASVFGVAQPPNPGRDGLGTTHHEAGALAMGEAVSDSVTLPDCRVRHITNAYVAGPALYPTAGSPNPMLTGVALARRLGDQLASSQPFVANDGFQVLFDGFNTSQWRMSTIRNQPPGRDNPGRMRVIDGTLETVGGNDLGLFWCTTPTPPNFILRLQWLRLTHESNSGVFVRFPNPDSQNYDNTAYVGVHFGFEVQIDELGAPDGLAIHRTGAIYRDDNRTDNETLTQQPAHPVGEWNDYEIHVQDQIYTVFLNGTQVCVFDNTTTYPGRGLPSTPGAPSFVGLQVYSNFSHFVRFCHVRIQAI